MTLTKDMSKAASKKMRHAQHIIHCIMASREAGNIEMRRCSTKLQRANIGTKATAFWREAPYILGWQPEINNIQHRVAERANKK
jgi:hypothetical protein